MGLKWADLTIRFIYARYNIVHTMTRVMYVGTQSHQDITACPTRQAECYSEGYQQ